jgi:hypothetical protein
MVDGNFYAHHDIVDVLENWGGARKIGETQMVVWLVLAITGPNAYNTAPAMMHVRNYTSYSACQTAAKEATYPVLSAVLSKVALPYHATLIAAGPVIRGKVSAVLHARVLYCAMNIQSRSNPAARDNINDHDAAILISAVPASRSSPQSMHDTEPVVLHR